MASIHSREAHHVEVCEQAVQCWRKKSSYGDLLSHVNYEGYGNVQTRQPWWTNEMDRIPWLSELEKNFVTVTGNNAKIRSLLDRSEKKSVCWM